MAEYIEKQAVMDAVEHITSSMSVCVNSDECHGMNRMQRQAVIELANLPSADVRPVVRGRWIPFTSEAAGDIWYCSACGVGFAHHMDFCPHCGADMMGGDAE